MTMHINVNGGLVAGFIAGAALATIIPRIHEHLTASRVADALLHLNANLELATEEQEDFSEYFEEDRRFGFRP